ncbi:hypothetical protein B0A66_01470 [Flavobacterium hercynium]|uniref:HTH cro/C1-type domain-containing protein n=1 Tax=Flavobacterium hercynium TaxID=387094 RepID=A0A226HQ01_9FLAO|nr:hypothetical protein B0A66_01470 [Flavobacterium hercynium]
MVRLGLLIKELREKEKITQEQLSRLCNVDIRTVQRIEKGKQNISISLLFSLADSLKIKSSVLVSQMFSENI